MDGPDPPPQPPQTEKEPFSLFWVFVLGAVLWALGAGMLILARWGAKDGEGAKVTLPTRGVPATAPGPR